MYLPHAVYFLYIYISKKLDLKQRQYIYFRKRKRADSRELRWLLRARSLSLSVCVLDGILCFDFIWRISLLVGMKFYSAQQICSGERQAANKMSRGHFKFPLFPSFCLQQHLIDSKRADRMPRSLFLGSLLHLPSNSKIISDRVSPINSSSQFTLVMKTPNSWYCASQRKWANCCCEGKKFLESQRRN